MRVEVKVTLDMEAHGCVHGQGVFVVSKHQGGHRQALAQVLVGQETEDNFPQASSAELLVDMEKPDRAVMLAQLVSYTSATPGTGRQYRRIRNK